MKVALILLVCLFASCLAVPGGGRRRGGSKNKRYGSSKPFLSKKDILSPTDNRGAAHGGVKIAPDSCLITWDQFENSIVGKDWIAAYVIDDDFDINPEVSWKFKGFWTLSGANVRRQGSLWDDITGQCLVADGEFERADSRLAKLRNIQGNLFSTPDRMDRFISCDPDKYFIFCICYVAPVNGRCPQTECFLMVPDMRPPSPEGDLARLGDIILDGLPWTKIEFTFKRCLDQLFVDDTPPSIEWVWQLEECPHPNSEAAKAL